MWPYHNSEGDRIGIICRWNFPDGGKTYRPVSRQSDGKWIIGAMSVPRPLYRLPEVLLAKCVCVCEGEKAADALRLIGLTATTSIHGANSPHLTDWSCLRGKSVVIVPDHDEVGEGYAAVVARLVLEAGAKRVVIVRLAEIWPEIPAGGDADDWVEQHDFSPKEFRSRLRSIAVNAKPVSLPDSGLTSHDLIPIGAAMDSWARQEKMPMVETGFGWFDHVTGGLPIGLVTGIAAQPDLGKTAICVQLAVGALLHDRELKALWAFGEGAPDELCDRIACVASGPLGLGLVTRDECEHRKPKARESAKAFVDVADGRLHLLNPEAELTIERIEAGVESTGARLVVIDYFQLLYGPDRGKDRVHELDTLMDKLKRMAIRHKCAVLIACEVSKAVSADSRAGQIGRHSAAIDYGCYNLFYGDYDGGERVESTDGTIGVVWHCKKLKGRRKQNLSLRFDGATQTFFAPDVRRHDEFVNSPPSASEKLP